MNKQNILLITTGLLIATIGLYDLFQEKSYAQTNNETSESLQNTNDENIKSSGNTEDERPTSPPGCNTKTTTWC